MFKSLVLPCARLGDSSYNEVSSGTFEQITLGLTGKSTEAQALGAGLKALVLAVDLVTLAS